MRDSRHQACRDNSPYASKTYFLVAVNILYLREVYTYLTMHKWQQARSTLEYVIQRRALYALSPISHIDLPRNLFKVWPNQ